MANETMMEQYIRIKNAHKNCLLMYRLGDFYELFFDDAYVASKVLGLTLTGRHYDGKEKRAPMCGVPHHSADRYIAQLIEQGFKVAICEQTEAPTGKGLVNREVVRIITPGTVTDENTLDGTRNNYAAAVYEEKGEYGIAFVDVTTGEFEVLTAKKPMDELARIYPKEVIINRHFPITDLIENTLKVKPELYSEWAFNYDNAYRRLLTHFGVHNLDGFGVSGRLEICAAGALMQYLYETQRNTLSNIVKVTAASDGKYMMMDANTRRNLELTENIRESRDKCKTGSLLWVLDKTKTAMGARRLRKWVEQPLTACSEINLRLEAVAELKDGLEMRSELRELLGGVYDLERITGKIAYSTANGRDLAALKMSVSKIPLIKALFQRFTNRFKGGMNAYFAEMLDELGDLHGLIEKTLLDEPPVGVKEGGIIKDGFNAELDKLRAAKNDGSQWLLDLEHREREATGIKNLKIRYNKIFGYYIEVTNSHLAVVPERFMRRQTLANCERYVTEELKEIEETVLTAGDKINALEYELFNELRVRISKEINRVLETAHMLACLDALQSLAEAAEVNGYTRPVVNEGCGLDIRNGRHPVVEQVLDTRFVANDAVLDGIGERLAVITGPNMAGKSTYMRQVSLITLMAQIGSFVPADSAVIGVVDRIFTRIGASDDLTAGASTFMVEMNEMAYILNNATRKSLIIVDEVGRGTSTTDGLAIAQAVMEYIAVTIGAKTFFATHFHELAELEGMVEGIVNYCFLVREDGDNIVFLRKIVRERMDRSYGIHVARLAGVPECVVKRSREIMGINDSMESAKRIYEDNHPVASRHPSNRGEYDGETVEYEEKEDTRVRSIRLRDIDDREDAE